jgi:hypothetical protein
MKHNYALGGGPNIFGLQGGGFGFPAFRRPQQHAPKHQPAEKRLPQRFHDDYSVHISAGRLKKWQAQLDGIEDLRIAIKTLSMSKDERMKLYGLTTHMKNLLGDVKGEIREKLRR